MKKEEFSFQTDMEPLLHLLTHSLYNNREIYLRELISNASDAINRLRLKALTEKEILGEDNEFRIDLKFDEKQKSLSLSDNGTGMKKEELIEHIGTIARSGTGKFLQEMSGNKEKDSQLIGQFGVGFYSVFMVTEEVTIETRAYDSEEGFRWTSEGKGKYTIEPIEKKERGTKITFVFKKDAEELASAWSIRSTVKKYSDYIPFPVYLDGEQINQAKPIWSKPKKEIKKEEYHELYKYLSMKTGEPLFMAHYNADVPVQFNALVFVPDETEHNPFVPDQTTKLHLYSKKVFIQDDCDGLLPAWLRFVYGVVDSEDLPLNVSRETTQTSQVLKKINTYLVKKLLGEFSKWSEKNEEKFRSFWDKFGNFIKEGLHSDFENREKLVGLYHFETSKSEGKLVNFKQYKERMKEGQEEIYYIYTDTASSAAKHPNMEIFLKNDLEVIFVYQEIDEFTLPVVQNFDGKNIVSIAKANTEKYKSTGEEADKEKAEESTGISESERTKLIGLFKDILKEKVSDVTVSDRLVSSPYTLVSPKDGLDPHMERMMKMMNKDFTPKKQVLELNLKSELIKNLNAIRDKRPQDQVVKDCIEQMYENGKVLEAFSDADSFARVNSIMEKMTGLYLEKL